MKNQYFGDINDYVKYGLLRTLAEAGLEVGACWMLTPDGGGPDGRRLEYLSEPGRWRAFDPGLFDALYDAVRVRGRRDVAEAGVPGVLAGARCCGGLLPDDVPARAAFFKRCLPIVAGADVVFFDPDNGMQIPSCPPGRKGSARFLLWEELAATFAHGSSVLVYQHFRRVKRQPFVEAMAAEMSARTEAPEVVALRSAHVAFFLLTQERHRERVSDALGLVAHRWEPHIRQVHRHQR